MTARFNSAARSPCQWPALTFGFCVDLAGDAKLRAAGVERIWRRGNMLESLDEALGDFRGYPGVLNVAGDLSIFGATHNEIFSRAAAITRAGIKIVDVDHPDETLSELEHRALRALHASKPMRNHRTARRRGSLGGKAKAAGAVLERATRCAEDIVQRLCGHPTLTWDDCAAILGPPFSKSTLQRLCKL